MTNKFRELHALAQLFTNDFDIELFQLLKVTDNFYRKIY